MRFTDLPLNIIGFAVRKRAFSTSLTQIDGIGQTRAKKLLSTFGSVEKIKNATEDELAAVPGMNRSAAQKHKKYYSNE